MTDWQPTAAEYHAHPAISSTALRTFAESPRLYFLRYVEKSLPVEESRAMRIGTAVHTGILEPHRFADEIAVFMGTYRRGKDWSDFEFDNQGKTILTSPEMDEVAAMMQAIIVPQSPAAQAVQDILSLDGKAEVSHRWIHEESGLECKVRWDWIAQADADYVLDLKAWMRSDPDGFEREAGKQGLGIQRGLYQLGYRDRFGREALDFIGAIRNSPPWDVGCYQTSDEEMAEGIEEANHYLCRLARTLESGEWWEDWQNDTQTWTRPRWARRKETTW